MRPFLSSPIVISKKLQSKRIHFQRSYHRGLKSASVIMKGSLRICVTYRMAFLNIWGFKMGKYSW